MKKKHETLGRGIKLKTNADCKPVQLVLNQLK